MLSLSLFLSCRMCFVETERQRTLFTNLKSLSWSSIWELATRGTNKKEIKNPIMKAKKASTEHELVEKLLTLIQARCVQSSIKN